MKDESSTINKEKNTDINNYQIILDPNFSTPLMYSFYNVEIKNFPLYNIVHFSEKILVKSQVIKNNTQFLQKFIYYSPVLPVIENLSKICNYKERMLYCSDKYYPYIFSVKVNIMTSILFGKKSIRHIIDNKPIYFTEGLWSQTKRDFHFGGNINEEKLESLFALLSKINNNSCFRLFAGDELYYAIENLKLKNFIIETNTFTYLPSFIRINFQGVELRIYREHYLKEYGFSDAGILFESNNLKVYSWRPVLELINHNLALTEDFAVSFKNKEKAIKIYLI